MVNIFFFLGEILSYDVKGYPRTADATRPGKNDRYASARGIEFREAGKPRTIVIRTLESLLPPKSNPGQVMVQRAPSSEVKSSVSMSGPIQDRID